MHVTFEGRFLVELLYREEQKRHMRPFTFYTAPLLAWTALEDILEVQ
jgi:lipid-A-disaccharide synthase-like uncharacterized protein